ncbi:GIY-YIG nuclease family protein [candidate division KSB1 bacterium]|nr:GIY-YIG nuclease family protein [candidate division KSB1 bacterium]
MAKSRKDLVREYKERPKPAGVFEIKNTKTGHFLLASSLNIEGSLNKHKFMLKTGGHSNKALQADYKVFGADFYTFEILEEIITVDKSRLEVEEELSLAEQIWIDELKPSEENSFNEKKKIREA